VILGNDFSFPHGDAATNRVHAYAKGYKKNGIEVSIICFGNEYNANSYGVVDGIEFYYPFGQRGRSKYFLVRMCHKIAKYAKTFSILLKIDKNDHLRIIHCYTKSLRIQLFIYVLSKCFKAKVCLERSEHPLRNYNRNALNRAYGKLRVKLEIILCDGIFCISNYLMGFYRDMGYRSSKLLLVPSTVDTDRFNDKFDAPFNFDYILYCGSLTIIKDGVHILIESFARITKHHKDIKLVLIGEADTLEDDRYFKDLVTTFNISHRVIFTGKLPRTEIPTYMCNAKILALARPKSIISDAGFPSKVTEYLASGVPAVLTNVGDIPLYLKDGFNAFISDPDSVTGFAEKLDFVLYNYQQAKKVSARGKELTETVFNYEFQAKQILAFIDLNLYSGL